MLATFYLAGLSECSDMKWKTQPFARLRFSLNEVQKFSRGRLAPREMRAKAHWAARADGS